MTTTEVPQDGIRDWRLGFRGESGYIDLLHLILDRGEQRSDRTGTGTLSIFGAQMRFDLREGFPLLTTKKVQFASVVHELLWFLRGSTSARELSPYTKIWDDWADQDGDLGPIYGRQWRSWGKQSRPRDLVTKSGVTDRDLDDLLAQGAPHLRSDEDQGAETVVGRVSHEATKMWRALSELRERRRQDDRGIDQISQAIHAIKTNPDSRRIIVSAWNVSDVPRMRLPPCHLLFQFNVHAGHLDCQLYQRSADMALGVPFNIASYALLMSMIARECSLTPRYFVHTLGDAHVYLNHVDGIREQIGREPMLPPTLVLSDKPVLQQGFDDVGLLNYQHHPAIKFKVSV